jgi:GWxTD domain-containing protein
MKRVLIFCLALGFFPPPAPGQSAKLRKELESGYTKWLREDVAYIISDEERQAWTHLATDDEREQFVEQFWLRRDPTPNSLENEFKEEHYRRIAYANQHFPSAIPGWKTDRGRIYITHGPPDEIESHPAGGGATPAYPYEQWRYRYIEGIGTNVIIEFVDPTLTGEFHMTMDPSEKEVLRRQTPQRDPQSDQFRRLEQYAQVMRPPAVAFRDLEPQVNSAIRFNVLPFQLHANYSTASTTITIQLENKDLQFQEQRAKVDLYARITTLSRRVVSIFEDTVTINAPAGSSVYQKSIPLAPGTYRLTVVARDVFGGASSTHELPLTVVP